MKVRNYVICVDGEVADLVGIQIDKHPSHEISLFIKQWCAGHGIDTIGVQAKRVPDNKLSIWKSFFENLRG